MNVTTPYAFSYAVGGPWYRTQVDARCALTIASIALRWVGARLIYMGGQDAPLDLARNRLLYAALNHPGKPDWLISLDADMSIPASHIMAFFDALRETRDKDVAIVGVPAYQGGGQVNVVDLDMTRPRDLPSKRREVAGIGTGIVAFRIDWYRQNWPKDLVWFQTVAYFDGSGQPAMAGEDFGHCAQVRRYGGKIVCDGRVRCEHHMERARNVEVER